MGDAAEGKNIAHQVKKMNMDGVRHIRDRFNVPVSDADIGKLPYITFPKGSEEYLTIPGYGTLSVAERLSAAVSSAVTSPETERLSEPGRLRRAACKTSARCWKSRAKRSLPLSLSFVL